MYVHWFDVIEDVRFDVTHLPGSRNPADPLTRRGFADGPWPAASTEDPDPEIQQELFSRLGATRRARPSSPSFAPDGQRTAGWPPPRSQLSRRGTHFPPQGQGWVPYPPRVLVCLLPLQGQRWTFGLGRRPRRHRWFRPLPTSSPQRSCSPWSGSSPWSPLRPDPAGGGGDVWQARRPARRSHPGPLSHPTRRDVFGEVWPAVPSGAADWLCIPAGGGLRAQVLR
jgi:hypothetical protein